MPTSSCLYINPAIERARYLPIYDLAQVRTFASRISAQPPIFICATATNDWATGLALPIGNAFSLLTESYLDRRERRAMINTIGHLPWLKTHDLIGDSRPPGYALTLLLRACRIFPLEDTDEQNDQALLDARHSAKRVHGNAYRQVTRWFDAERRHPHSGGARGQRRGSAPECRACRMAVLSPNHGSGRGDDAKAAVRAWPRVKSASISMVAALDRPGHSHQPVKKSSVIEGSVCKIQRDDRNKCSSR